MARPGKSIAKQSEGRAGEKYLPVGGRVRKLRVVEDQSAPIPEEIASELRDIIRTDKNVEHSMRVVKDSLAAPDQ